MKRIWFTQQKPINYAPLRAGLGYINEEELYDYNIRLITDNPDHEPHDVELCPKIYTTRTHKLKGEYYVVGGSRYNAKAIKPRIEFRVSEPWELNLAHATVRHDNGQWNPFGHIFPYNLPELDLGIKGVTFNGLRNVLLGLNRKATLKTPFWIHRLERITKKEE